jgi:hypothetical protein
LTDADVEKAIATHLEAIEALRSMKRAVQPSATSGRYISPSQATAICGRSESQVRRDCELNPIDAGGFGFKSGGRWLVDRERYIEMRGNACFKR